MRISRRRALQLAAGAVALPAVSRRTAALDYPSRPVRIVVGFPPGEVGAALADPGFVGKLAELGLEPLAMRPAELGNFAADYTAKWEKAIHAANIKAE